MGCHRYEVLATHTAGVVETDYWILDTRSQSFVVSADSGNYWHHHIKAIATAHAHNLNEGI